MSTIRGTFYAIMAAVALVGGYSLLFGFIGQYQSGMFGSAGFFAALLAAFTANPLSTYGFAGLLFIFAGWLVWHIPEARSLGMKSWWLYPILAFTTPFVFVFFFYLFMRERALGLRGTA